MGTPTPRFKLAVFGISLAVTLIALSLVQADHHEPGAAVKLDPTAIGEAAGTKATVTEDGVVRLGWPRTDVAVEVDGVKLKPFAGLGSWAAFIASPHGAMMMGDTVVFQDEVDAAMDAAFANGLEVTALHNHFFFDKPKVYFMHIGGAGDQKKLAAGVKAVWDAIKKVRANRPQPAESYAEDKVEECCLTPKPIEDAIGHKAAAQDGIVKITIGRPAEMHGVKFAGSMGLTTWIAFTGDDALAAVGGDFAMTAGEVQPTLHALRKAGFHIVSVHNHMMGEKPGYFFVHFWAKGKAIDLAKGFKSVLDAQAAIGKAHGSDTDKKHDKE